MPTFSTLSAAQAGAAKLAAVAPSSTALKVERREIIGKSPESCITPVRAKHVRLGVSKGRARGFFSGQQRNPCGHELLDRADQRIEIRIRERQGKRHEAALGHGVD